MKRYLIQLTAISLLALATGCQKEQGEINNPQNNQSVAVNISIDGLSIDAAASPDAGDAATTRAAVEDITDITTHGFTIAGYYTHGGVAPDPVTDGGFDANIATTKPNVFDYQGGDLYSGDAVLVPVLRDGKYEVVLSKWQLRENSCLSYVAWASKVAPGENATVVDNPILDATKNGVVGNPYINVNSGTTSKSFNADVVAAKSIDNVNDVVRSAVDLDFKHVMTKLKFSVKNNSRAAMTLTEARVLFADGKVARKATYTFDGKLSRVGTWGTYDTNEEATYPITLTTTNLVAMGAAVPLEELLIIPQALTDGAISVELTYTIPNGATAASSYTRTVPLKAKTFEQNTSYTYEIALSETTISINEGRIGAWMDVSSDLPYVPGLRDPNVQLLLDAYDAPYTHTDGNQYWLDRSGWNRHCKLVGGVTYDATGKFYKFTDSPVNASYVEVPKTFTATTGTTFETIARSTISTGEKSSQVLFNFIGPRNGEDRIMFTHFNFEGGGIYFFDAGGKVGSEPLNRVTSSLPDHIYREFAMYAFTKGPTVQSVRRNLFYLNNTITMGKACAANLADVTTAQIGKAFKGEIRYFKISTTAKTTIDETEYATLSKRHKIPVSEYVPGYIRDNLMIDLQGVNRPEGGLWKDMSGNGAHAKLVGNVTYDPINKEYHTGRNKEGTAIDTDSFLEIQLPESYKAAGFFNEHTLEIVYNVPLVGGAFVGGRHNHFVATDNANNRIIFFHSGYSTTFTINYQSPLIWSGATTGISYGTMDGGSTAKTKTSYYAARAFRTSNDTYLEMRYRNVWKASQAWPGQVQVGAVARIVIGQDMMNISAVRLYKKSLYYLDNLENYKVDKATYNIP